MPKIMFKVNHIYINGYLYAKMMQAKQLVNIAYFIQFSNRFKNKFVDILKLSTTEYKHLLRMQENNLAFKVGGKFKLASNSQINETFGKPKNVLFFNDYLCQDINKLKYFLKTIPILSNVKAQKKSIEKKEFLNNIKVKIEKGIFVTKREYNIFKKHKQKGKSFNLGNKMALSIKKCSEILLRSSVTACKYRKIVTELSNIIFKKSIEIIKHQSYEEHFFMRKFFNGFLKYNSIYNFSYIYKCSNIEYKNKECIYLSSIKKSEILKLKN